MMEIVWVPRKLTGVDDLFLRFPEFEIWPPPFSRPFGPASWAMALPGVCEDLETLLGDCPFQVKVDTPIWVENLWKSEWLKISEDDRCLEFEICIYIYTYIPDKRSSTFTVAVNFPRPRLTGQ